MSPGDGLKRIVRERSRASLRDYWDQNKGFIAWVVLAIAVAAASIQSYLAAQDAQNGVDEINEEHVSRVNAQSSINAFFCQQNNHQNAILGRLVEISLEGAPRPVTRRQTHELRSVEEVENRLTHPTNCHELALQLARATGVNPSQVRITPLVGVALEHLGHVGNHRRPGDSTAATKTSGRGAKGGGSQGTPAPVESGSGGGGSHHPGAAGGAPGPTHHPATHHPGGGGGGSHGAGGDSSPAGEAPGSTLPAPGSTPSPPPETGGGEAPSGGEGGGSPNSNSLKVCALQPLLKKCIEVQL